MNEFSGGGGYLCLGSICLTPIVAFAVGLLIGRNKVRLPFRVRIERTQSQSDNFEVDDGTYQRE